MKTHFFPLFSNSNHYFILEHDHSDVVCYFSDTSPPLISYPTFYSTGYLEIWKFERSNLIGIKGLSRLIN